MKDLDVGLGDDVVLVLRGKVKQIGKTSTESSGEVEFVKVRADAIEAIGGEESQQWRERFKRLEDEQNGVVHMFDEDGEPNTASDEGEEGETEDGQDAAEG